MKRFWAKNKRKALANSKELSQQCVKHKKVVIEEDLNFCQQFLDIADLSIFFSEYLDVVTLYSFSRINTRINHWISTSKRLALQQLKEIVGSTLSTTILGHSPSSKQLKEIYQDNKNICINAVEHPFVITTDVEDKCVKTKSVFTSPPVSFKEPLHEGKVDHLLHMKITGKKMELFHKIFQRNSISDGLKRLASFSNSRVPDCYVTSCKVTEFIKRKGQINVTRTSEIDEIESSIWQHLTLTSKLNCIFIEREPSPAPVQIRGIDYFLHYWDTYYAFSRIEHTINWEHFEIAGGSPFQALIAMSEDTINTTGSDLDLFAHGITYKQFLKDLNYFEQGLIKEKIKSIKSIIEKNTTTYFLIYSPVFQVKIQFIFRCVSANIATILTSFDMAQVQISFNPKTMQLSYTTAFSDFIQTGIAAIFDITQNPDFVSQVTTRRIIKYHQKGVRNIKVPSGINLMILKEQLNNASQRFTLNNYGWTNGIPIQIGGNLVQYLLWSTYPKGCFSEGSCIKSNNHDETNILRMFLRLLLFIER